MKAYTLPALLGSVLSLLHAVDVAASDARTNYILGCMGCHGETGTGSEGKVPSFRTSLVFFASIPEGRKFLVQVPGSSQSPYNNAELADILNWMMQNLSDVPAPSSVARFTAEEVAAYRGRPLKDLVGTRSKLLARSEQTPE